MAKVLDYKYSSKEIDYTKATKFKELNEKNDCSVRAVATAVGVEYNDAHVYMNKVLKRVNRKGAVNMVGNIMRASKANPIQEIAGKEFEYEYIPRAQLKNVYKLYGEKVARKKTVKSFMDTFRKGTYLVFVSNHVFTVKDGVLVDNAGEEFRPTRKVIDVVKVNVKENDAQLTLFDLEEPVLKKAARKV